MTYDELSEGSKAQALETHRYDDVRYDEWWDNVYEDATQVLKFLGFDATRTEVVRRTGTREATSTREVSSIHFSGFCSQGDGASFTGDWRADQVDLAGLFAHAPQDDALKALGARVATILLRWPVSRCRVMWYGNSSHSNSMSTENPVVDPDMDDEADGKDAAEEALAEDVLSIARDAADWVYDMLEQEHDYLTGDAQVIERLKDMEFTEGEGYCAAETDAEV